MSITKAAVKKIHVFVDSWSTETGACAGKSIRQFAGFMCLAVLLASVSPCAIATPLSSAVSTLDAEATDLNTKTGEAAGDVNKLIDKYRLTNAGQCALLVAGLSSSNSVPIYFIPGPTPVDGFQADVIVGPGVTITNVTAGPVAIAAEKNVASAPVPGGQRIVLFGVNPNPLGAGIVANVNLDMTGASVGEHIIALVNFVAAQTGGTGVPLCVTTGVISK